MNFHNKDTHWTHARFQQMKQKFKKSATLLNLYSFSESDEMISSEMSFSSNILTSVLKAVTIDDKYSNFNLSDNDIDCNTVVES